MIAGIPKRSPPETGSPVGQPQARTAPARADNTLAAKALEGGHLCLYEKLVKAGDSALCQARTGKIGL